MKNSWIFAFLGLFTLVASCSSGHDIMTMDSFYEVPTGTKKAALIKEMGKPYAIHQKGPNEEEYEYIEKVTMGQRVVSERHYYFLIRNGVVVSKRMEEQEPLMLDRNAIDIQSSMNF